MLGLLIIRPATTIQARVQRHDGRGAASISISADMTAKPCVLNQLWLGHNVSVQTRRSFCLLLSDRFLIVILQICFVHLPAHIMHCAVAARPFDVGDRSRSYLVTAFLL